MPVKRRNAKRRTDPQAELQAWSGLFKCGFDFFDELEHFGFPQGGPNGEGAKRAAAKDAWTRLGAAFLPEWNAGGLHGRPMSVPLDTPWALNEFGDPHHARNLNSFSLSGALDSRNGGRF